MPSIAELIMSQQQPNLVGSYVQGQSQGYQLDKMASERAKTSAINNMLQAQAGQLGGVPAQPELTASPGVVLGDGMPAQPVTGAQPVTTQQPTAYTPPAQQYTASQKQNMQMFIAAQDLPGLAKYKGDIESGRADTNVEFLKEERKNASQDVRSFNNQAQEMRTSYKSLEGLAIQAKGTPDKPGSRGARNAMVVKLARLISPGIVTETEAAALSGGQNTTQAVLQALSGKGIDTTNMQRYIDPYGDTFDADGLLQVGKSIVASSRQPLIDKFESSRSRAKTAGLTGRVFDANFINNPNYTFLQTFGQDEQPVAPAQPDQPQVVDLSQYTIEQLMAMKEQAGN